MRKHALLHLAIFASLSSFAFAQHEIHLRDINVVGVPNRERPDVPNRGERSEIPSPSNPSGGTPAKQPTSTLFTTILAPDEERIFSSAVSGSFQYSVYGTKAGYSYSASPGVQTIESFVPIDALDLAVTKNEKGTGTGLGPASREVIGQVGNNLKASGNAKAIQVSDVLRKLIDRDLKADQARMASHIKHLNNKNDPFQQELNQATDRAQRAVKERSQYYGRPSPFNSPDELESAHIFTQFNLTMAKELSSPYSPMTINLGSQFAMDLSRNFLDSANQAVQFIRGYGIGTETVLIDTYNGTRNILRSGFDGMRNPVEMMNMIYEIMQNIDPSSIAEVFSQTVATRHAELNSGIPAVEGRALGQIITNFALSVLPMGSPIPMNIARIARQTAFAKNIYSTARNFGQLTQAQAYNLASLFSKAMGPSIGSEMILLARNAGARSYQELQNFGLFADKALSNQVGAIGEFTEEIAKDYSAYYKSFPKGAVVTKVLNADDLNAELIMKGRQISFQANTLVTYVKLVKSETYLRFHRPNIIVGEWLVKESEVMGMSPLQVKEYLNIKHVPTNVSKITLQAGEEIIVSKIGKNDFGTIEGGTQVTLTRLPDISEFYGTRDLK